MGNSKNATTYSNPTYRVPILETNATTSRKSSDRTKYCRFTNNLVPLARLAVPGNQTIDHGSGDVRSRQHKQPGQQIVSVTATNHFSPGLGREERGGGRPAGPDYRTSWCPPLAQAGLGQTEQLVRHPPSPPPSCQHRLIRARPSGLNRALIGRLE